MEADRFDRIAQSLVTKRRSVLSGLLALGFTALVPDLATNVAGAKKCKGGKKRCNGTCVSIKSDPNNCGACGTSCGSFPCYHGACGCSLSSTECHSACFCGVRLRGGSACVALPVGKTCDKDRDCPVGTVCGGGGRCYSRCPD
jgi:hypothetical protein